MAKSTGYRHDVFGIGKDSELWHAYDSGTALVGFEQWPGGKFASASSAVPLPNGDYVVYANGQDGRTWRVWWHHDTGKVDFEPVFNGSLLSAPLACIPVQAAPTLDPSGFAKHPHHHQGGDTGPDL